MDMIAPLGAVYQAGTLSGNPIAMCAGEETLKIIEQPGFYQTLEQRMEDFLEPIRHVVASRGLAITIQSIGSMFAIFFGVKEVKNREDLASMDENRFKHFFRYLFERGVYLSPSAYEAHFISAAHTQEHLKKVQRDILQYLV
jgi:glutamate-1-semialdehyde 2,1-aminomutase